MLYTNKWPIQQNTFLFADTRKLGKINFSSKTTLNTLTRPLFDIDFYFVEV